MRGHLVTAAAATGQAAGAATDQAVTAVADPGRAAIQAAIASGRQFWLDLAAVDPAVLSVLSEDFGFHPLAVEDSAHFSQRPKIDEYDDFVLLVAYGIAEHDRPVEVHCFVGERFLVTVHREAATAVTDALGRLRHRAGVPLAPAMLLHLVLDSLVDEYFPALEIIDDAIDSLQDEILRRPTEAQLGELFALKRRLLSIRRLASDQRDMMASVLGGNQQIPSMSDEAGRYFRDLYDHLAHISQTADSYRDLLSSALDTHLSTTSNRLNVVMKQLAIIATVFLPMSFLTGFFGQNFGWMVTRLGGSAVFWVAGVGLQVAVAAGLLLMFRRMGWLGGDPG